MVELAERPLSRGVIVGVKGYQERERAIPNLCSRQRGLRRSQDASTPHVVGNAV